jgi:hypothetical protein
MVQLRKVVQQPHLVRILEAPFTQAAMVAMAILTETPSMGSLVVAREPRDRTAPAVVAVAHRGEVRVRMVALAISFWELAPGFPARRRRRIVVAAAGRAGMGSLSMARLDRAVLAT